MDNKKQAYTELRRGFFDPIRAESNTIIDGLYWAVQFSSGRLLDVGCGLKPYSRLFSGNITHHIGTDLRPQSSCPPEVCANSAFLPFKEETFDTVLCTQVLEHVRDPFRTMSEVGRVLRPKGYLIMTVPAAWPLHEEPHDFFRYTKYSLEMMAKHGNLKIVAIKERGGAFLTIGQLVGAVLYDVLGKRIVTRVPFKIVFALFLAIFSLLDRMFYYPKLTLGYVLVAQKQ